MKKPITNGQRVLFAGLALLLLFLAGVLGLEAKDALDSRPDGDAAYFDPYDGTERRQVLGFNLLSDSFATFTLGENHGYYFAIDSNEYGLFPYIVCMSNQQFADCKDIYDFTFSDEDWDASPGYTALYGYPVAIEGDLRDMAIEYFNYFFDEEVLDASNFSDYVGDYYLDATYQPDGANDGLILAVLAAVFFAAALLFFFLAFRRNPEPAEAALQAGQVLSGDGSGATVPLSGNPLNASSSLSGAPGQGAPAGEFNWIPDLVNKAVNGAPAAAEPGEVAPSINHGLGILGAIGGALIGGILWVILYRAGYIAGIAGYLAVFLAMKGYEKLGGGTGRAGTILSVLVAAAVIVLSNCVAIAWIIVDNVNKSNPGRASIGYVLQNFGAMMDQLELWGSFFGDLVIGLLLGFFASIGPIGAGLRAAKARKEQNNGL